MTGFGVVVVYFLLVTDRKVLGSKDCVRRGPYGGHIATTRFYLPCWCSGSMPPGVTGAAADASHWVSEWFIGGWIRADGGCVWSGAERDWLRRRPKRYN